MPQHQHGRDAHEQGQSPAAIIAGYDERRLSLVRAAYEIIAAEGFERLRTRDVAAKVGINIATLHYYFGTKEALIQSVALYLAAQFETTHAPQSHKPAVSPRERLLQELADARFYCAERPEMLAVMQELNARARRDPVVAGILEPLRSHWRRSIEAIVAAGMNEGVYRSDLAPREAASVIVAMLWGAGTLPLDAAEREHVYGAVEQWLAAPGSAKRTT